MDILYQHDMRQWVTYAVLWNSNRVLWVVSTKRGAPTKQDIYDLKNDVALEDYVWFSTAYGADSTGEKAVVCSVRPPKGQPEKGRYTLATCRLRICGPDRSVTTKWPTSPKMWQRVFLIMFSTTLDAAIFDPKRAEKMARYNEKRRVRLKQNKKRKM